MSKPRLTLINGEDPDAKETTQLSPKEMEKRVNEGGRVHSTDNGLDDDAEVSGEYLLVSTRKKVGAVRIVKKTPEQIAAEAEAKNDEGGPIDPADLSDEQRRSVVEDIVEYLSDEGEPEK